VHVPEHVDRRLLHARIGRVAVVAVVLLVETPSPLDGSGAELSAPLLALYSVRWCVVVPGTTVLPKSVRY